MKKQFSFLMIALALLVSCSDDDNDNVAVDKSVRSYIETAYPGAVIRHAEKEFGGLIEVEFLHDNLIKDAYFTTADEWVYTEWDVALVTLPKAVADAVSAAFPDYRIDDADYLEFPDVEYYRLELEKGNLEKFISVTSDGTVITE